MNPSPIYSARAGSLDAANSSRTSASPARVSSSISSSSSDLAIPRRRWSVRTPTRSISSRSRIRLANTNPRWVPSLPSAIRTRASGIPTAAEIESALQPSCRLSAISACSDSSDSSPEGITLRPYHSKLALPLASVASIHLNRKVKSVIKHGLFRVDRQSGKPRKRTHERHPWPKVSTHSR